MNKLILIIFFCGVTFNSQTINIKDYGAKGNGTTNDTPAFNKAIYAIYATGKSQTIYLPVGTYLLDSPILLKKWVNLLGEDEHNTILKVKNYTTSAITIVENKDIKEDYNTYTSIKNLTIEGPYFGTNFYAWIDIKKNNTNSVGIKILGY
jgi:polygalacturonase